MILGRFSLQGLGIFGDPNKKPKLTLNGPATMTIRQGRVWNDPGALVDDDNDGVFNVYSGQPIDTSKPGAEYELSYNYTDSGGLKATTITRKVIIEPLSRGNNAISFLVTAG